jgi:hypothetical protein
MVNIVNNFKQITTAMLAGLNPVMPAVNIQGVAVTAVTFSIIWAAVIFDGLIKSPTSALCCISQSFNVLKVRLMITKFTRLEFELFTKPSKSDFLRDHLS